MTDPTTRLNAALEGRYKIERMLGEGGMATVYLAEDLKHDRKVALKVLKPELGAIVGAERFLGEIKVTATLQHPHIQLQSCGTPPSVVSMASRASRMRRATSAGSGGCSVSRDPYFLGNNREAVHFLTSTRRRALAICS